MHQLCPVESRQQARWLCSRNRSQTLGCCRFRTPLGGALNCEDVLDAGWTDWVTHTSAHTKGLILCWDHLLTGCVFQIPRLDYIPTLQIPKKPWVETYGKGCDPSAQKGLLTPSEGCLTAFDLRLSDELLFAAVD